MAKQVFSYFLRQALWVASGKKCGYCSGPLSFSELEIDHIVPESLGNSPIAERQKFAETHGLASDFDVHSMENLIASCRACNAKKGKILLLPGSLAIRLALAAKEKPRIEALIEKFQAEDERNKLRFMLASALESGTLKSEEVSAIVSSAKARQGTISLSSPFPLFGENPLKDLSRDRYEEYLDTALVLPDYYEGSFRLVNGKDGEKFVTTLRQYRAARQQGYEPDCNAAMKSAHVLFDRPLKVLSVLRKAQLAERSFVDEPKRGLSDLDLLPASLLSAVMIQLGDSDPPEHNASKQTIGSLVTEGEAKVVRVGSDLIEVHHEDDWTYMFELMRTDVDGDGIQDIVIHWGGGPLRGTLAIAEVVILSRRSEDEIFSARRVSGLSENLSLE